MTDYGIRISHDAKDVSTCDDTDCVVTSKYSLLKGTIAGSGTVDPDPETTVTIAHNLGYIPTFQAFIEIDTDQWQGIPFYDTIGEDPPYMWFYGYADSTNIYLVCYYTGVSAIDYKYFIYVDKGYLL